MKKLLDEMEELFDQCIDYTPEIVTLFVLVIVVVYIIKNI